MTVAFRTFFKVLGSILIAATHATVAVVVYRAVAYIVLVHQVDYVGYGLWIVCGVSVYLHIEYMAAAGQLMIRGFYLCFVPW